MAAVFLAGVVCRGGFPVGEVGASVVVVMAVWGFFVCMLCCPMIMWCIFGAVLGHLKADDTPLNDLSIVLQSPPNVKHY